jgi:integrase/recombinase XerD
MSIKEYLQQELQPLTVRIYLYEINKYKLLNTNADNYDYQRVMQYVEQLRKIYAPQSISRVVASLKKYYNYLIEIGKRKDNPAQAIKLRLSRTESIQLQDLLTPNELQTLLKPRIERYPFLAKRNQVIMSLLVNQALKLSEIVQLKIEDINLEKAKINITGTAKTNKRVLPLKAEQIILLYHYIKEDRDKLITFRTKGTCLLLSKIGEPFTKAGIESLVMSYQTTFFTTKSLTVTTIRQSVITNLLAKNNDLRIVQEFAGHKSLDTTEKYKETGLHELKTAIEKLHPIK